MTRQSGDGYYYDSSSMMNEFPFQFKKVAGIIQFIHINTMFRADEGKAIHEAIKNNLSNSIISKGKILSQPHPEDGSILVDANEIFLRELISNASDALDKYRIKCLQNNTSNEDKLEIKLQVDKDNKKIILEDTGIGMTSNELKNNLGTIARSGTSS